MILGAPQEHGPFEMYSTRAVNTLHALRDGLTDVDVSPFATSKRRA